MKAYPLLLLTLVGASLCPNRASTPVYAEATDVLSSITITPTGLDSCEVVSDLNVRASYSQSGTNASEIGNLSKDGHAVYIVTGLGGVNIASVSFSAQGSWNPHFSVNYSLNDGDIIEKSTNFKSLYGKDSSDGFVDLIAPFEYPLEDVDEFRFELKTTTGTLYVQSLTITYEEGMDPFAKAMISGLSCDVSGVNPPSVEEWNAAKDAFEMLSAEEQDKYMKAEADADGDTYQRVVAKYDYILSKYGVENYVNFLGRVIGRSSAMVNYDGQGLIAVFGLSIIEMATFGFLLMSRKRKRPWPDK